MTKPRHSEHISLVPWSFVLIYQRSTGTVEMYLVTLSPLDLSPKSALWSYMYLSGFRISHESSFNINTHTKKNNNNYPNLNSASTETTQVCFRSWCENTAFLVLVCYYFSACFYFLSFPINRPHSYRKTLTNLGIFKREMLAVMWQDNSFC